MNGGTKGAARLNDDIEVTIQTTDITTMAISNPSGLCSAANSVTLKGKITKVSDTVKIGD